MKLGTAYFIYKDGAMRCREDFKPDGPSFYEFLAKPSWSKNSTPDVMYTDFKTPKALEFPYRKFLLGSTPKEITYGPIYIYFEILDGN